MKNKITFNRIQTILFVALLTIGMAGNVKGATITAVASSDWSLSSTWDNGLPTSNDDVIIPAQFNVNVDDALSAVCNNLTLNSTSGTNLTIGDNHLLAIYGTLNGPNTSFTNLIITTSGTGEIQFVGSNSRPLFGNNWSAEVGNWACEVALDAGVTGTASTAIKIGCLVLTSGTLTISNDLRIDVSGSSSLGNGSGTILINSNGNLLVTGNMGAQTTDVTTYCNSITIGGKLTVEGDYLNASSIAVSGTLIIKKTNSTGLISYPLNSSNFNNTGLLQYEAGAAGTIFSGAEISQAKAIKTVTIYSPLVITLQSNATTTGTLTINSGATLNVASGVGLTVNAAKLSGSQCLVLKTSGGARPVSASFIDNNGISDNTGTGMRMELGVTGAYNTSLSRIIGRYWYFSSPVSSATSNVLPVGTDNYLWSWDNASSSYTRITNTTTPLEVGRGYEMVCKNVSNTFNFIGTPNKASLSTISISRTGTNTLRGFYLFGNPYPCSLDWNSASIVKTNMSSQIVYRSCDNSGAQSNMVYDTWSGNVGTQNNQVGMVTSRIQPMQAVWVRASTDNVTGTITVGKAARLHDNSSMNFLKSARVEPDQLRLALTGNGRRDELIFVQSDAAVDDMDNLDAVKLFTNSATLAECYTPTSGQKLVIDFVKPFTTEKVFPVAINIGTAGDYKFVADLSKTNLDNLDVFLEDKATQTYQNLKTTGEYTFTTGVVKDSARFLLHYKSIVVSQTPDQPATPTGLNQVPDNNNLLIYTSKNNIYIKNCVVGSNVVILNLLGQQVYATKIESESSFIPANFGTGCYIVNIANTKYNKSKKVFINK